MSQRIKNIFHNCNTTVDCILLKNASLPYIDDNFFYVTNLDQGLFEGSCAVLYPDGSCEILVSELEAEGARKATARLTVYKTKNEYSKALANLLLSVQRIGVNANGISYHEFTKLKEQVPKIEFVDVSDGFTKTRFIKDDEEIHRIKKACQIADDTMATLPDIITDGMTENELAAEINYSLQSFGAEKPAFDTISSFGKNTAEPHYGHGEVQLRRGDLIVCDFGACYKKYNSDITRTFMCGKASRQQREMYETVLHAQQCAFDAIQPGLNACDIHHKALSSINATQFKGTFIHSTGHSLGLSVHDGSGFAPDNTMELQENMVLTVEPGVYLPGVGGVRIEDDILIKKNGVELLTKSPRVFLELKQ
ncbi:MAG: aminopeptidase P family protein [Candidatus Thermoplasmatota archaeon]|nr:aminopeptidase P family protein [Candidatus Thermoplasmatota archaeon]